jgi:hypothetical protein
MLLIPYSEALSQIKEADVLLFRGKGFISWLIKRYGSEFIVMQQWHIGMMILSNV